jgi:NADH-quinone oxidoreductase subunit M
MTLTALILVPVVASLVGACFPARVAGWVTALGSTLVLGMAITLAIRFHRGADGLQWATDHLWISALGVHYKLGLDGLNVFLVLTTAFIFLAAIVAANVIGPIAPPEDEPGAKRRASIWERPKLFYFQLGLAESAVLGAFLAQDLLLFVAFFDLMLIPFYFLVGVWGTGDRIRATTKLVIYTLVGSLLMLAAAIATGVLAGAGPDGSLSFAFSDLARHQLSRGSQEWIVLCFGAAFLVKMPAFPFHGWLPDGYRSMPIPALAAFSGVLSKVAAYGFLRIVLPLFPIGTQHWQTLFLLIALASVLYGSAMAFTTTESRLILGYSSMAQLGFITLGIFSLDPAGAQGALLQMVNHAIVTAPLFFIVALLAARAHGSEDIRDMGGLAFRAPVFAAIFLIVALATLAMPGSANFAAEFLILLGVFRTKAVFAIIAFTGVVLASVYMLRMFIRTMHNRVGADASSYELRLTDKLIFAPLVAVILALALYPQAALKKSDRAAHAAVAAATSGTKALTAAAKP